jgi:hypothetical protein
LPKIRVGEIAHVGGHKYVSTLFYQLGKFTHILDTLRMSSSTLMVNGWDSSDLKTYQQSFTRSSLPPTRIHLSWNSSAHWVGTIRRFSLNDGVAEWAWGRTNRSRCLRRRRGECEWRGAAQYRRHLV